MRSLICGNNKEDINETIRTINDNTYYYFRNLLEKYICNYSDTELLSLSGLKQIGLSLFDDEKYFYKIQVALNLLNKAYNENPNSIKRFFDKYQVTYVNIFTRINELSNQFAFVFGNKPSNFIIVHNLISWYKTLCEGIYRDVSKVLYYCTEPVNQGDEKITEILEWIGFGEICGRFKSHSKQKLNLLTEGVDSIIRHSEAHVDYIIDEEREKVILRNRKVREKIIEVKEYEYFNFLDIPGDF
jgi:hypothetical protein